MIAGLHVDWKLKLKCGDLQGINAGLMSLGRVISCRLKHELFTCSLKNLSDQCLLLLLCANLIPNKILSRKKAKLIVRDYNMQIVITHLTSVSS